MKTLYGWRLVVIDEHDGTLRFQSDASPLLASLYRKGSGAFVHEMDVETGEALGITGAETTEHE